MKCKIISESQEVAQRTFWIIHYPSVKISTSRTLEIRMKFGFESRFRAGIST